MFQSFRHAATWVHTWFSLVLGFVLVVVFFFGALSVFDREIDREIDRWAIPASRFDPQPMPSFDRMLRPIFESIQPDKASLDQARTLVDGPLPTRWDNPMFWSASTTHRDPVLDMSARWETPNAKVPDNVLRYRTIDLRSGKMFSNDQLKIGSQFFYPLHTSLTLTYDLTTNGRDLGMWIVGFAALVMLVALISGVVMHRKILPRVLHLPPREGNQRSVLGLLIVVGTYFPVSHTQLEPLHELHEKIKEQETGLPHNRTGVAAPLASVDAMLTEA